ncbi:MAG: hypothetical protein H6854_00455 [Rhodospirillales bacterium]|nr:hypothetical protein [Rhodospirillales bacterium]
MTQDQNDFYSTIFLAVVDAKRNALGEQILSTVKHSTSPGPGKKYLLLRQNEIDGTSAFCWGSYAGMGDDTISEVSPAEAEVIDDLINRGFLLPTFPDPSIHRHGISYTDVTHFDDLRFARTEEGNLCIYRLQRSPWESDCLLELPLPQGEQVTSILLSLEDAGQAYEMSMPIEVRPEGKEEGTLLRIYPVITDPEMVAIHKRNIEMETENPREEQPPQLQLFPE